MTESRSGRRHKSETFSRIKALQEKLVSDCDSVNYKHQRVGTAILHQRGKAQLDEVFGLHDKLKKAIDHVQEENAFVGDARGLMEVDKVLEQMQIEQNNTNSLFFSNEEQKKYKQNNLQVSIYLMKLKNEQKKEI